MRNTDIVKQQHLRSPTRYFRHGGEWYLLTREGDRGPFGSRDAAQLELVRFVDTMTFLEELGPSLPGNVNLADVTLVEMDKTPL